MTLKINPLNVFDIRRTNYPPNHFDYAYIPMTYNIQDALEKWILHNLKHRFYIGKDIKLDEKNSIANYVKVGFEDEKELSYFMLACPYLKYK